MIVVTLFGTTAGLEVKNLSVGAKPSIETQDQWLALSDQDTRPQADHELFRFDRRIIDGKVLTWIGLYRDLPAVDSQEQAGYYGAGLWIYDAVVPGQLVAELLVKMADQIKNLALSEGRFVKKIGDILSSVSAPAQLMALPSNTRPVVSGISPNGEYKAFLSNQKNPVASSIDWAQRSRTAEIFNQALIGNTEKIFAQANQAGLERFDSVTNAVEWAYSMQAALLAKYAQNVDSDKLITLENENEILRSEFEKLRKKLIEQNSIYGKKPGSRQSRKNNGIKGFLFKNWPLLILIIVLMATMSMFALLWQEAHLKNKAYAKEITSLIRVQKELRNQLVEKRN